VTEAVLTFPDGGYWSATMTGTPLALAAISAFSAMP
jgi:hypothetical protein